MKVEIKLNQYDGTVDECAEWFYTLEKTLTTMRVPMQDFLLYATNNTAGTAKDAILVLDRKFKGNYQDVKTNLIGMFDTLTVQEVYEYFMKQFK